MLLVVFGATAGVVLALYGFANRRRLAALGALRERGRTLPTGGGSGALLRDMRHSTVPFLERWLSGHALTPAAARFLHQAGVRWTLGEFVLGSALLAALGLLAGQPWGLWSAAAGGGAGLLFPATVAAVMRRRRLARLGAQLPDALDMIVNAMRAGFSFQAAMQFVGEEMPDPIGGEFLRFHDAQRLGVDVRHALLDLEARIGSLDVKLLVTSLLIQRETGGNLAEILTGLATLIRDRAALHDQIDTLTAEPRFTGAALAVLPVLAFGVLAWLNPPMMRPMFDTPLGQGILAGAAGAVLLGYAMLRRIAHVDT